MMSLFIRRCVEFLGVCLLFVTPLVAQQLQGSIEGTIYDVSGGAMAGVKVTYRNLATNLSGTKTASASGNYQFYGLPAGTYELTFSKDGFQKEVHPAIEVQGDRTTTVNGSLKPGSVAESVTVTATPLLNQVDTTNGYVLGELEINSAPLGTGSFTQLAILTPGVNADFLNGSGSNAGLGNQAIWANGQRDSSNSITVNGIDSNNLFNGKTTSQVTSNRFVLNTNENFLGSGEIQTSSSVYDAIGQALPTPPVETIEEIRVNASMYDASQGASSGAHVDTTTKSGTNQYHGEVYEYHQTDAWNAAPFFRNADTSIPASDKVPKLHYNRYGATIGGPIIKDKLFFFGSYQGIRTSDELNGTSNVAVPAGLTDNNRTLQGLTDLLNSPEYCDATKNPNGCVTTSQISSAALKIFQYKLPNGQYLIPTPGAVNSGGGYDVTLQKAATFNADQVNANIDYDFSAKDRLAGKYYFQNDPGTNPFAVSSISGFDQTMKAGSQVFSLLNTTVVSPNLTWDQKFGFIRMKAFAASQQPLTSAAAGINVFGSPSFPGINIRSASGLNDGLFGSASVGPNSNFANAGVYQNRFDLGSNVNWVHGIHTVSFGFNWNTTQLNVINKNNEVASLSFGDWPGFITGSVLPGLGNSAYFNGTSNRYYRAKQAGFYVNDKIRVTPTLNVTLGLRWDWDGPLTEKNGNLTNFYTQDYAYNLGSDSITNIGLVVAGNNKNFGTKGVSDSTLTGRQWILEPRIGLAWSPSFVKNFVVRAGFGLYADRGQFFTEFSPSAGFGYNGPFGVTLEPPFIVPVAAQSGATFENPFGTTAPPPPPKNLSQVAALVPCQGLNYDPMLNPTPCSNPQAGGIAGTGLIQGANPFLFGGYDPRNTLPYSENWTLDLQWQPVPSWVFSVGYVGNHAQHLTLPIPFNQPKIATPAKPVNGQIYSYGYVPVDGSGNSLLTEPYNTSTGGNTDLRSPYLGYSPNSVFYKTEGISNYNALQVSANKRLTKGLTVNAAYTWSHTLDEQSGLGLFYTGNDPLNPRSGYGNADFDRTHVFTISYQYELPKFTQNTGWTSWLVNGWAISGVTVFQSGQPYSVYDYSGSAGGIFYSANDYITNPILPVLNGKPSSAVTGNLGTNPNFPALNPNAFGVITIAPGTSGVPPCGPTFNNTSTNFCDNVETGFSTTGRNTYRGPFQNRFDFSVMKNFKLTERFQLKYRFDAFNIFNHPSFDTPNNNITFNGCFNPVPCYASSGSTASGSLGVIQHTIGSPRFLQMSLRLLF